MEEDGMIPRSDGNEILLQSGGFHSTQLMMIPGFVTSETFRTTLMIHRIRARRFADDPVDRIEPARFVM